MTQSPILSSNHFTIEYPLEMDFDFNFDLDTQKPNTNLDTEARTSDSEPRSPRTPTYTGEPSPLSGSVSPFDVDRFFSFPLISPSEESSPISTLRTTAAESFPDLRLTHGAFQRRSLPPPLPPSPKSPVPWIWTCHLCHSRYPLGATRRCLVDGHFYCSGDNSVAAQKNIKRKKRGQACSSEFDYVGWQNWGNWKKDIIKTRRQKFAASGGSAKPCGLRGCEACEYPSQCRYERLDKILDSVPLAAKKVRIETSGDSDPVGGKSRQTTGHVSKTDDDQQKENLKIEIPRKGEASASLRPNLTLTAELVRDDLRNKSTKDNEGYSSIITASVSADDRSTNPLRKYSSEDENGQNAQNDIILAAQNDKESRVQFNRQVEKGDSPVPTTPGSFPDLQRTKSRVTGRPVDESPTKQSRIFDFFNTKR